jgi:hypothetical protein
MSTMSENKFNNLPSDTEVISRARTIFRDACENTDSYHALRLGLARRKSVNNGTPRSILRVWMPLAGAAACCALVAGIWLHPAAQITPAATTIASSAPATASQDNDDALVPEVGSSQMEMVQDLDFYRWLAAQPSVASAAAGGRN